MFLLVYRDILSRHVCFLLSFPFQLKKEICEAHDELRALYEELRSSHASSDSVEIDDLEPDSDFKPGCLTTFVKNFRDVLEEMVRDNSTRTTVRCCRMKLNIISSITGPRF